MNFAEVERIVEKLRGDLAAGNITQERFKKRLREIMVQDEAGNWWMVGYESGKWYRHDGNEWIPDQPPGHIQPAWSLGKRDSVARQDVPRPVRNIAWWMLGLSILLIIPTFGASIIGILSAVGMLQGRSWGRDVGLVFSLLLEAAGFIFAVGIVLVLFDGVYHNTSEEYWLFSIAAMTGMSLGIIFAYLLSRESILLAFGKGLKHAAGAWPISIPVILTGFGIIPALGLLLNRNWGKKAVMVFLGLLIPATIICAIGAGTEMIVYTYDDYYSNDWGFAIAIFEAIVVVAWCCIAFFYLKSMKRR